MLDASYKKLLMERILELVQNNISQQDVFTKGQLEQWAFDNGWQKINQP